MKTIITPLYKNSEKTVIWDITSKCNLKCKHCYQSYNEDLIAFSKKNIDEIIDILKKEMVGHIHILGGEPLLYNHLLYLIEKAKKNGLLVTINTNGTMLTEKIACRLSDLGLDQLSFSLDGATESINDKIRGEGVFSKVDKAVYVATKAKLDISITYTISDDNFLDFENVVLYCIKNKIKYLRIIPVYNYSFAVDNNIKIANYNVVLDELYRVIQLHIHEIKKNQLIFGCDFRLSVIELFNRDFGNIMFADAGGLMCQPGNNYFLIKADATVVPCVGFSNIENNCIYRKKSIYNLKDLLNIDSVKLTRQYRDDLFSNSYFDYCERCSYFKKYCTPCPFYHADNLEQCRWADKRLKNRYKKILNCVFSISSNCIVDYENLKFSCNGQECKVNSFLLNFIMIMFKNKTTIKETIQKYVIDNLKENDIFDLVEVIDYMNLKGYLVNVRDKNV